MTASHPRRMQQLLGDETAATNDALIRELFLQRLPINVRVVLASTPETASLYELAQLADRIVDAAPPTISGITTSQDEVEKLHADVSRLTDLVSPLTHTPPITNSPSSPTLIPTPFAISQSPHTLLVP